MSSHLEGGGPPLPTAWPTFPPAVPRGTACLPCQALLGPSWPRTRSPVGWRGPCHAFFSHSVPQAWGVQGRAVQAGDRGQGIPQRAVTGGCPQRGDCGLPGLLLPGLEGPAGRPGRGRAGPHPHLAPLDVGLSPAAARRGRRRHRRRAQRFRESRGVSPWLRPGPRRPGESGAAVPCPRRLLSYSFPRDHHFSD